MCDPKACLGPTQTGSHPGRRARRRTSVRTKERTSHSLRILCSQSIPVTVSPEAFRQPSPPRRRQALLPAGLRRADRALRTGEHHPGAAFRAARHHLVPVRLEAQARNGGHGRHLLQVAAHGGRDGAQGPPRLPAHLHLQRSGCRSGEWEGGAVPRSGRVRPYPRPPH
ncbi:hypothetical protein VTN96DRAFT_558 [Rasamsonia emersonii]